MPEGTAIGYEHGPSVQAGILLNQHIIEKMFQDIITNGTDVKAAAKKAEDELNAIMESVCNSIILQMHINSIYKNRKRKSG